MCARCTNFSQSLYARIVDGDKPSLSNHPFQGPTGPEVDRLHKIFKYVPDPPFLFLVAVSLFVGGYIPAFYDWSGANQSRSAPVVNYLAIGLVASCLLVCITLPWLPLPDPPRAEQKFKWFRLIPWGVLAGIIAGIVWHFVSPATSIYSLGFVPLSIALICQGLDWTASPGLRWRIVSLAGCLYLPLFWVTNPTIVKGLGSQLVIITALPALLPAVFFGRLFNTNAEHQWWLAQAMTSIEIVIGLWMIHLGTRRALAWLIFLFLQSTLGSFVFNALLRM